jgi:AcrR family transcriptional regulator
MIPATQPDLDCGRPRTPLAPTIDTSWHHGSGPATNAPADHSSEPAEAADTIAPGEPASVDQTLDGARATRHALLVAAAEQFYAAGYHAGSLREIVTNAGVTKGALYFHFPHKRALAEAVITEMNATWAAMITETTARGLDPLHTMLALSDARVAHLIDCPIVRGGIRLLHDPVLRSAQTSNLAAQQYHYAQAAWATQLAAAARAGLLLPCLNDPQRAQLAQSITATINGHHMICDLTGADTELWDRVTAMWQHLLPLIATEPWLDHWRTTDWAHRPHPRL